MNTKKSCGVMKLQAQQTFAIEITRNSLLVKACMLATMTKAAWSNQTAWMRNGESLHFSQWLDKRLFETSCDLRLEICLRIPRDSAATASLSLYGEMSKRIVDVLIAFPDQILGLDKLHASYPKTTFCGTFFNLMPGEHDNNLFDAMDVIAKGLANALEKHLQGSV